MTFTWYIVPAWAWSIPMRWSTNSCARKKCEITCRVEWKGEWCVGSAVLVVFIQLLFDCNRGDAKMALGPVKLTGTLAQNHTSPQPRSCKYSLRFFHSLRAISSDNRWYFCALWIVFKSLRKALVYSASSFEDLCMDRKVEIKRWNREAVRV